MGVGLNMFFLHLLAWYCKAACTKCQVPLVGVIEEGSTEQVRISPASPTGLKKNTPKFMEKASVFSGYGLHSLSPGSMALGEWMLRVPGL